jgi:hypothetical protein
MTKEHVARSLDDFVSIAINNRNHRTEQTAGDASIVGVACRSWFAWRCTLTGIKCPHCGSALALDRIGVHLQKFCAGIRTATEREASMRKYNQFYTHLQSHSRGEITIEELQIEANKLFSR